MRFGLEKYTLLALAVFSTTISANTLATSGRPLAKTKLALLPPNVVTLSGGPTWRAIENSNETFFLTPSILKTYNPKDSIDVIGNGELFIGSKVLSKKNVEGQIGLAAVYAANANISGEIWDDGDPRFNNYTYKYKINHTHLALKGKLVANKFDYFMPWASASIGYGFNNAKQYYSKPIICEAVPTPEFQNRTWVDFAYVIGAGFESKVAEKWHLGIGYEFSDWGASKLGAALDQTSSSGLTLDHLYTNGLIFSITYTD